MKVNISISKGDSGVFEDFKEIEFSELDKMSEEEKKKFIEEWTEKAVRKIVDEK